MEEVKNVAIIGNPNSGKTSLFNQITGLNQKVGNFSGVTVEKKTGSIYVKESKIQLTDLPGIYSIYPRSADEKVVFDILSDDGNEDHPDLIMMVVDASNLERNLLLFTEISDLGIPTILVLNMVDLASGEGLWIDKEKLAIRFNTKVLEVNARSGEGIEELKAELSKPVSQSYQPFFNVNLFSNGIINAVKNRFNVSNNYLAYQMIQQPGSKFNPGSDDYHFLKQLINDHNFSPESAQTRETIERYKDLRHRLEDIVMKRGSNGYRSVKITAFLDKFLAHGFWSYFIFAFLLLLIFQSIFSWAEPFMDIIDQGFVGLSQFFSQFLPSGVLTDLLVEGIIPGIGGIMIFIPQIALLFGFIAILEETGYMSRAVFLTDRLMRQFGLNGKSVVPLISGMACAVPAIMATRNIENWKNRLVTIMITPLISCSARLPVYAIIVALIIPEGYFLGFFTYKGLTFTGLYVLGFVFALVAALVINKLLRIKDDQHFLIELPVYRWPRFKNIFITIFQKCKTFVWEAGRIILVISIILWFLSSYGPGEKFNNAEEIVKNELSNQDIDRTQLKNKIAAHKLEHSYAGIFGKAIEPAIEPLGFNWKIGIALITSFAAREVFVGTIATIYSVGTNDNQSILSRLRNEVDPVSGEPYYSFAVGMSLLVFYAFAMQCMSTLAITQRETRSWKYPMIQLFYMTGLAYLASLLVYNVLI